MVKLFLTHNVFLLLLSVLLSILPFSKFQIAETAWFCYVPLFVIFHRCQSLGQTLRFGLAYGFLFSLGTIYWFYHVAFSWSVFVFLFCSLYKGLFAYIAWFFVFCEKKIDEQSYFLKLIFWMPLIGVAIEFFQAEIPILRFGWALLGLSQTENLPILQFANLLGVYGVSWLLLTVNALLFGIIILKNKNWKNSFVLLGLLVFLLGRVIFYGNQSLAQEQKGPVLRIGVIQTNIPQELKWNPAYAGLLIEKVTKLIERISHEGPDVVILPEASFPGFLNWEFDQSSLKEVLAEKSFDTLIGAPRMEKGGKLFNSAFLIKQGEISGVHDKLKLVPFGEYIPFESFFSFVGLDTLAYSMGVGTFMPGEKYTLFSVKDTSLQYGTLICFEDTMADLARGFRKMGADFLVNITNDAWFLDSAEPYQHLQSSIMRAVENGCFVVRAANTGISTIISPKGKVLNSIKDSKGKETFVMGTLVEPVFVYQFKTFYQDFGFLFPYFSLLFIGFYGIFLIGKKFLPNTFPN